MKQAVCLDYSKVSSGDEDYTDMISKEEKLSCHLLVRFLYYTYFLRFNLQCILLEFQSRVDNYDLFSNCPKRYNF